MGSPTYPSIHYAKNINKILYAFRDPKDNDKTLIKIHSGEDPFEFIEQKSLDFGSTATLFAVDRRTSIE